MDLLPIKSNPELNFENEVTKKIVMKIINEINEEQKEQSKIGNFYRRSKIINFFVNAEILFKYHDIKNSGELNTNLFPQMARQLRQIYDAKDIKKFENEMKTKKLNKMNLPMFLTLLKRKLLESIDGDEVFNKHFNVLDMKKENKVYLDELKTYLKSVGDKISPREFDLFINYNVENNSKLTQSDFVLDDKNKPIGMGPASYKDILTCYKHFQY